MEATFHQLYGGGQGCYGGNDHIGKGVTEIDAPTPAAKFASKVVGNYFVVDQYSSVTLGELFAASGLGTEIQTMDVYAYLSPADENEAVRATFNKVNDDWTMSTFVFTGPGEAKITISDYYYCEPTVIYVFVKCTHESFDEDGCCIHCGAHRDDVILNPEIPENHRLSNDAQVREILEQSGKVKTVFQGHYHKGNQSVHNGITYRTFPAMCEGEGRRWVIEI